MVATANQEEVDPASLLTDAGFPNPHVRANQPRPAGPPVALGPRPSEPPVVQGPKHAATSKAQEKAPASTRVEDKQADCSAAKAQVAEAAEDTPKAKDEAIDEESTSDEEEEDEEEEEEDEEVLAQARALADILSKVTPCADFYPVTLAQASDRQRNEIHAPKWSYAKGLRLMVKPANADDCILLVANCMLTPEINQEESNWAIHRAGHVVSPTFATHSRQLGWSHHVCMPYVDQPGKRMELDYQVGFNSGSTLTRFVLSPERQRRHFFAVTFPAYQVSWVEEDTRQAIAPGTWNDVDGTDDIITVLPGDKVLCICTIRYDAQWSSEMNRGRFTIARDDFGLDGLADRGLQSVRALGPDLKRVALMATVDDPPPGPHLYRVRSALTTGCDTGVVNVIEGDRQLALLRLPGHLVHGPCRTEGPVTIDSGNWMEIPGLSVTVNLRKARDKVMIVYHTDCNPEDYFYEAHFTVFRRGSSGSAKNIGYTDGFGIEMISSDYRASSEYPVGILCDSPGALGTWTYYMAAKVVNTGTSSENPMVTVGYSGSITGILLTTK